MKKNLLTILLLVCAVGLSAQTAMTREEAKALYRNTSKARVSIHDPSVVYNPKDQNYYIFGSHKAGGRTSDMINWYGSNPVWGTRTSSNASNSAAFVTPAVKTVKKGGEDVAFPAFNAMNWSAKTDAGYNVNGNMWAPGVVWNPTMKKFCFYLSVNGNAWHSSIVLLTSDNVTGPYVYQGPVVICGFDNGSHSYKDTDLEIVLGTQSTLPARYNVGNGWGRRWPHTIDACVFYDDEGKLWMVYGSWSGGIWMLELDEETGLRDYDVTYPSMNGNSDGVTSDPYYGKKVGGGFYVSGEGPYIEKIGNYYYLFITNGGLGPNEGYVMRVFRSSKPNGPYTDTKGTSAIYGNYAMNYGTNGDTRGEKVVGSYNKWGFMTVGECAQGHNSIIAAPDGRTYLIYHTKFNDGTVGHQVRTHQVFLNKDNWLVVSPFEYNGEQITDADIASKQPFTKEEIAGTYQILIHKYNMDHANYEEVTPVEINLLPTGRISGAYAGTWSITEGTGYITVSLAGNRYNGVIYEEVMDGKNIHTISFTGCCAATGVNVWGYKMTPKYELAWFLNNMTLPISNGKTIAQDVDLSDFGTDTGNLTVKWTSSDSTIVSNYGKYNPYGLEEDTPLTLTLRVESCGYYYEETFDVKAQSEANAEPTSDWKSGMIAHYGFNDNDLSNTYNPSEVAELLRTYTGKVPKLESDYPLRTGDYVHIFAGAKGKESYVKIPNPLYGQTLEEGATISFWLYRADDNLWDALFGFLDGESRFYMTGNSYFGYNDGNTSGVNNWLDINHPESVTPNFLTTGKWQLVTIVMNRKSVVLYVDGSRKSLTSYKGSLNGTEFSKSSGFDYNILVDHLTKSEFCYLGYGSFWGSPNVLMDDVIIYNRPLSVTEVISLRRIENRLFDFSTLTTGIDMTYRDDARGTDSHIIYDLSGRVVKKESLQKGIYIMNGKKVFIK